MTLFKSGISFDVRTAANVLEGIGCQPSDERGNTVQSQDIARYMKTLPNFLWRAVTLPTSVGVCQKYFQDFRDKFLSVVMRRDDFPILTHFATSIALYAGITGFLQANVTEETVCRGLVQALSARATQGTLKQFLNPALSAVIRSPYDRPMYCASNETRAYISDLDSLRRTVGKGAQDLFGVQSFPVLRQMGILSMLVENIREIPVAERLPQSAHEEVSDTFVDCPMTEMTFRVLLCIAKSEEPIRADDIKRGCSVSYNVDSIRSLLPNLFKAGWIFRIKGGVRGASRTSLDSRVFLYRITPRGLSRLEEEMQKGHSLQ